MTGLRQVKSVFASFGKILAAVRFSKNSEHPDSEITKFRISYSQTFKLKLKKDTLPFFANSLEHFENIL